MSFMKVLIAPYSGENPYQENLKRSLENEGVLVVVTSGRPFDTFKNLWRSGLPDVLHLHWLAPFITTKYLSVSIIRTLMTTIALLIAKILNIRIIWTVHEILDHNRYHPNYELFIKRVFVKTFIDEMIVHTESAKRDVRDCLGVSRGNLLNVIPHGHFIDNYPNTIDQATARDQLKLSEQSVVFLYFGLIREYKDVPRLIKSYKEIETKESHLLIVGKPESVDVLDTIRTLASGVADVSLELDFISDEQIQLYMNAADAVVLPYKFIGTSGSAILAMSFSKALIVPKIGDLRDVVNQDGCIYYDPLDNNGLKEALSTATERDLKEMGEANYSIVREYDWNEIGRETLAVYT